MIDVIYDREAQTKEIITIHPSWKQFVIEEFLPLVLIPTLIAAIGCEDYLTPFHQYALGILAGLFAVYCIYRYQYLTTTTYTITDEQLCFEMGVFTRNIDFVELYRVVDYREQQSFMQKLIGVKTITIYSGDHSTPQLHIKGIDNNLSLIAEIRSRVEDNKLKRRIYEVTNR